MELILYANSKNGITYTPDTLVITIGDKTYEYDIQGSDDFQKGGLDCRVKGELLLKNNETDDYEEMTDEGYSELIDRLKNPNAKITVSIYPAFDEDEKNPMLDKDELSEGDGFLSKWSQEKQFEWGFKFKTVFYGI